MHSIACSCFFRLACRLRRYLNSVIVAIADLFAHGDWVPKLVKCIAPDDTIEGSKKYYLDCDLW